jgi:hypothetical protein
MTQYVSIQPTQQLHPVDRAFLEEMRRASDAQTRVNEAKLAEERWVNELRWQEALERSELKEAMLLAQIDAKHQEAMVAIQKQGELLSAQIKHVDWKVTGLGSMTFICLFLPIITKVLAVWWPWLQQVFD